MVRRLILPCDESYEIQEDMIKWKDVLGYATNGNPTPPKRVEKTEDE